MNIGVGDMGLTLAQLTQAIRRKVDEDMETVVAEGIAEHALGFFGFSIIFEILPHKIEK